jgi:hypothetical protein
VQQSTRNLAWLALVPSGMQMQQNVLQSEYDSHHIFQMNANVLCPKTKGFTVPDLVAIR